MNLLKRLIARLRGDESGVAAVEFALLAPVLILLYFGMAEGTQALLAERKAVRTASAIGDLVAQYSSVTPAQIDDMIKVSDTLMRPFPTDKLKVCVLSIESDKDNKKKVGWARVKNAATCKSKGNSVTDTEVPADLIAANQSLIMARVTYTYEGPTSKIISASPKFEKTFYLRPRKSQTVLCPTC